MGFLRRLFHSPSRASDKSSSLSSNYDQPSEDDNLDPWNPFPEPIALEITDVFDLHSIQPRDVSRTVTAYLNEARARNFQTVRIIHGKGIGVQREIVRSILSRTEFVTGYSDAPAEAGGWGATIVQLSFIKPLDPRTTGRD